MKVLFDTSILSLLIKPNARPPLDPKTGKPLEHFKERIVYALKVLKRRKATVIIPSPVLCEVLVKAGSATADYVELLNKAPFRTANFDHRAAIECSEFLRKRWNSSIKNESERKHIVKFDHQIIAVGLVEKVDYIYSDDSHIATYGESYGIPIVRSYEMPVDPETQQQKLDLM